MVGFFAFGHTLFNSVPDAQFFKPWPIFVFVANLPHVRVTLQACPRAMSRYTSYAWNAPSKLKKTANAFMS
jgi:hypothetical protein